MQTPPIFLTAILCLAAIAFPSPVEGGPKPQQRPSLSRTLRGPQSVFTTNRYRPRIRFDAGEISHGKLPLKATFSTQAGHIDRVEARLDGEIIGTVKIEKLINAGTLETAIDLSKIPPGEHQLTLWVWQGREGYRRLHGESKTLRFRR